MKFLNTLFVGLINQSWAAFTNVVTPSNSSNTHFDDTTFGMPWYKDPAGNVHAVGGPTLVALTTPFTDIGNNNNNSLIGTMLPAQTLTAGSTIRIILHGQATVTTPGLSAAGNIIFRLYVGNNVVATITNTPVPGTSIGFKIESLVTIGTTGTTGTCYGSMIQFNSATTGLTATAISVSPANGTANTSVGVNTTVANSVVLAGMSTVATAQYTIYNATLQLVK